MATPIDIRIFGTCLATPSRPTTAGLPVDKVSILTPCCPRSRMATDGKTQIDALFTYLIVEKKNFDDAASTRKPDVYLNKDRIAVFIFHREEITIVGDAASGVLLETDGLDLPGEPNDSSRDVRWTPRLQDLMKNVDLKSDSGLDKVLCTRLVVRSGKLSARFPCDKKQKRKMKYTTYENYLAQELFVALQSPNGALTLECRPFDGNQKTNRIVLEALGGNAFHVFFAAGPLSNVFEMGDFNPCNTSNDHSGHTDFDYEFETLWDLFDVPSGTNLPVPEIPSEHGPRQDCVPGGG